MVLAKLLGRLGCFGGPSEGSGATNLVPRRFKFVKNLGTGASSVFLVEHISEGAPYVLKQTDISQMEEAIRCTAVNEVLMLACLDPHPHVVDCPEVFLDGQQLCVVMELVSMGTLADVIKRHAEHGMLIAEDTIWSYLLQMLQGLRHLHSYGIIHRNLKPQNVLINAAGKLQISDPGMPKVAAKGPGSSKVQVGTPHYAAPEVWRRKPHCSPADVWALGCILHELCSLKPLFLAPTEEEVESKVTNGSVPPISEQYSSELRDLITAMLQCNAADRPTIEGLLFCEAAQSHMTVLGEEAGESRSCLPSGCDSMDSKHPTAAMRHALPALQHPAARDSCGEGMAAVTPRESSATIRATPSALSVKSSASGISLADSAYESSWRSERTPQKDSSCRVAMALRSSLYSPSSVGPATLQGKADMPRPRHGAVVTAAAMAATQ